jgi:LPXTG-motif cell wall-anchored protein
VYYEGLTPGNEYTIEGILMDKATKKPVEVNGKPVTGTTTFTAKKASGMEEVVFELDASDLIGKDLVVFEKLFYMDAEIANHEDIEDTDQTVRIKDPKTPDLQTIATGKNGEKAFEPGEKVTIIDQVYYEGLTPGNEYTIEGILMDKETKKPVEVNGKPVTGTTTFTAKKASGMEEVVFELDASDLIGKDLVVFEKLFYMGVEIADHEDINDPGQTVRINDPQKPIRPELPETKGNTPDKPSEATRQTVSRGVLPSTGESTSVILSLIGLVVVLAGTGMFVQRKRKQ